MIVVDVAAMGVAVVPILESFVGSGRLEHTWTAAWCLISSAAVVSAAGAAPVVSAAVAAPAVVRTTVASAVDVGTTTSATIVVVLLVCVNGGRGLLLVLLLHGHAVLLHRAELALERRDRRPLRLNAFLRGSVSCAKICNGFAIGGDRGLIFVDGGHPVSM